MGLRNEYVSTMIYEELANGIIECVGGTENIASAINCMTRVRIRVNRDAAVRDDDLRALDGVLSVTHNQQGYLEVVVGPGKSRKCIDVFRTLGIPSAVPESQPVSEKPEEAIKPKAGVQFRLKAVLKTFGQIFAPLIPGVIAAGICAGVASLISQAVPGYTENKALSVAYSLLTGINAAFMAYLTGWAGYRTAEVFGGTPILGGMVGMFTTLESVNTLSAIVGLYNEAQPLNAILRSGRGGVLAAVVGVWLMCKIEAAIHRRIPDALDVVVSPILTLFATLVPYVFVVMPATGQVSMGMCRVVGAIAVSPNPFVRMVSGFLGALLFLPMVATGMHHGLIALYTVQLETFGYVTLYPALAMAGAGQVGAALAIAFKARRIGNMQICRIINGALPAAVLGVGEPLIYGVTLPMGKPFITAGIGAGFGGAFVMLMEVASTTWGPSGILGVFVMTEGPRGAVVSIACYVIGLIISCIAAFLITAVTIRDEDIAHTPEIN